MRLLDRVARLSGHAVELGWLIAVLAVPIYFNIDDLRIFEPDKATLLRDLAAVLGAIALARLALCSPGALAASRRADGATPGLTPAPRGKSAPRRSLVRAGVAALRRRPTLAPMVVLAATTLLATATSILPAVSWNGSYARAQGALTTLAYLSMALLVAGLVRRPGQAGRLGAAVALSGVIPAAYGWVQHFGHDPLPWQQPDLAARVPGTMGNPIFLGALLVMTIPLALYRLALALRGSPATYRPLAAGRGPGAPPGNPRPAVDGWSSGLVALGWAIVVAVELGGLYFTKSRGPFAGLLVALAVFGLSLARAWRLPWLRRCTAGLSAVALAVLVAGNLFGAGVLGRVPGSGAARLLQWTPGESGSSEVRLLIWVPALALLVRRPVLGCGPDAIQYCYYPVYPAALRHIEAPNAVPDRMHNILLDAAVETGALGLAALLALLVVTARTLWRIVVRGADPARRALAAALLAALAGHLAEGFFGIGVVATQLLTWVIAGLAGALAASDAPAEPAAAPTPDMGAGRKRGPAASRVATGAPGRTRWPGALAVTSLAGIACAAAAVVAWQVMAMGATATAADVAARRGADLEFVALANAGQAPLPPGRAAQPILALRQFAAAAASQAAALRMAPDQEEYSLDAGRTLVEWGQAAAAIGGVAAQQAAGMYARALLDLGHAARLNPYDPDPLRDTGKAYERWAGLGHDPNATPTWNQDFLDRAAQAFARAARLAPRHPDPLTSWAQVALWQGRPDRALALAGRALALDAQDGDGYRLRGAAEAALGRPWAALTDWRRALRDPNLSQRGVTAARLALAEATWARARCAAVRDAHLAQADLLPPSEAASMTEIIHVDGSRCPGAWRL